jgi:hypothetical protein
MRNATVLVLTIALLGCDSKRPQQGVPGVDQRDRKPRLMVFDRDLPPSTVDVRGVYENDEAVEFSGREMPVSEFVSLLEERRAWGSASALRLWIGKRGEGAALANALADTCVRPNMHFFIQEARGYWLADTPYNEHWVAAVR